VFAVVTILSMLRFIHINTRILMMLSFLIFHLHKIFHISYADIGANSCKDCIWRKCFCLISPCFGKGAKFVV